MEQINTIDKISAVYRNTAEEARQELNKVQQKIYRIGSLRLLLFVAGVVGIIYFWSESWGILACIALITLLPFLFLMKYHNRLFHRKDYLEKKMEINEQELAALDYDTSSFDDGEAYIDPTHLYTYDLDVFGPHSLFQYINRTCTQPGKHRLAHWLGKHLERKEEIRKFTFECVYYGLMDELEDEGKKKDLGFLLNRAIDYLDEIGLTPAEKFKAEISDTLQRMIEKEKR